MGVVRALNSVGRGQAGRGKDLSPQSPCATLGTYLGYLISLSWPPLELRITIPSYSREN